MPARSKFTAERRATILEALRRGNARSTAAALAGVNPAQITRWLRRGRDASDGSTWREFAEEVERAEAIAAGEMVEVIRRDAVVERNAKTAIWWLERRDASFRAKPTAETVPEPDGVQVIQLTFERPQGDDTA